MAPATLGLAGAGNLRELDRDAWAATTVAEIMRTDVPTASPAWSLRQAIREMELHDTDRLAVCDGGAYVGVITHDDLIQLDEVLGAAEGDRRPEISGPPTSTDHRRRVSNGKTKPRRRAAMPITVMTMQWSGITAETSDDRLRGAVDWE